MLILRKSNFSKMPQIAAKHGRNISQFKKDLQKEHKNYNPFKKITRIRTKPYAQRKYGLEMLQTFPYNPHLNINPMSITNHPIS
jgi:hypothetical protein